jgi:acetyl esterase/lipase
MSFRFTSFAAFLLTTLSFDVTSAQTKPQPAVPTHSAVAYGTHPKQVLDFYRADSTEPTAVVVYIHGGAWLSGSREINPVLVKSLHHAKISVASISYRFTTDAAGIEPPVKAPLMDAARAVQFLRSKAAEWNIDKTRIGATGGSAGGFSALWLAFHDDMADPKSDDPVLRESTRLACASVSQAQTTLDPKLMQEWTPNAAGGAHAFGFTGDAKKKLSPFKQFLAEREQILPLIQEYSPINHVTADDPPIGLYYGGKPMMGQDQGDPLHNPNWGVPLAEKCKSVGVECLLVHDGTPDAKPRTSIAFLIVKLKAKE